VGVVIELKPYSSNWIRYPFTSGIYRPHQYVTLGYWHQEADERDGKPPQGTQELLVAKDKVGRPPGEFGVYKSIGCDIFLQCFDTVGWATGRASGL